ncbi:MAG TPA: Holliday junction branch migration protein RuvA [Kofleriaceae bacterium]|nr:Holliday junction branch migration protein RuvA [Kofleriaceae bacterium]
MIARLDGVLIERMPPHIVVDVNGVGYDVVCSAYTIAGLPADGERVTLRVFTHASENKVALFGFIDQQERALFDLLITVKNVGPSTAIAILSGSSPRDIAALIANEDVPGLTRLKGVGKKTAELLVVELHEKCAEALLAWDAAAGMRSSALPAGAARIRPAKRHPLVDEVMLALVGMGWRPAEAEQAVVDLPVPPEATIEQLLRQALQSMPR